MPAPRAADPLRLQNLSGRTMGTLWSLRLDNPAFISLEHVRARIEAAFEQVVAQMSTWESDSDICRYNHAPGGSTHRLAPEFVRVLECALTWARASQGAIDPTVGPLIGLWGFGANARSANHPSKEELEAARRGVGWHQVHLDSQAGTLPQPGGVELDFSGIAKGFAVDMACAALQEIGLHDFVLEVGGEVRASGQRPDGLPWRIRVEAAEDKSWAVELRDISIATSGDRWHTHADQGRSWSHTIDPRTGRPVGHPLTSVSVLHTECMQADALATLLTVLGPAQGMAFAQQHNMAALFVVREHEGTLTPMASPCWPGNPSAA